MASANTNSPRPASAACGLTGLRWPKRWRAITPRTRLIGYYGIAMACGAMLLDWLEVQFLTRRYPVEIYVVILCLLFTGLGVWLGHRLTRARPFTPHAVNTAALHYLGISRREQDVLALLAEGRSNREIADALCVSVNTVKTHLQNLYQKLDVARRGQAVEKARSLKLVG